MENESALPSFQMLLWTKKIYFMPVLHFLSLLSKEKELLSGLKTVSQLEENLSRKFYN